MLLEERFGRVDARIETRELLDSAGLECGAIAVERILFRLYLRKGVALEKVYGSRSENRYDEKSARDDVHQSDRALPSRTGSGLHLE